MCSEIEETFKMIEEEADRLREERRAKMKEIKENMSNGLWREGNKTRAVYSGGAGGTRPPQ